MEVLRVKLADALEVAKREERIAYARRWYLAHKEERKAYNKKFRGEHKEELKVANKKWMQEHKEYRAEYLAGRRRELKPAVQASVN